MDNEKTTAEMLEEQIRKTIEELDDVRVFTDETVKPVLEKLKVLHMQQVELLKVTSNAELKKRELDLEQQKQETETEMKNRDRELKQLELELEHQKLENDTAIRIREVELKEASDKKSHEIEEAKVKEQRKANTTQAVIGGVTAATGVAGILATLHCFKKSMIFEQTGSYTNKSGQMVGSMFNLFRRKG